MPIKHNLNHVINSLNSFSAKTQMVAINTSIRASKISNSEGAAFKVLAREIQDISAQSKEKLEEIHALINEIAELSKLINKTGSLRMLLMQIVNNIILDDLEQQKENITKFEQRLTEISSSFVINQSSKLIISKVRSGWQNFQTNMPRLPHLEVMSEAYLLIDEINILINEFEKYAGE